jgi:cbb3-type cytochrome oxidase subunit 3
MEDTVALVAITAMLVAFTLPLVLVAIILYYKHRKARMAHETITRLVEKGLPVPSELLEPPRRGYAGLRGGLVLVGLGIALSFFFAGWGPGWSIGLIPGLMGIALLISWKIESRPRA